VIGAHPINRSRLTPLEKSHSWEADSRLAVQEIPGLVMDEYALYNSTLKLWDTNGKLRVRHKWKVAST
jgi:hypothetical protein